MSNFSSTGKESSVMVNYKKAALIFLSILLLPSLAFSAKVKLKADRNGVTLEQYSSAGPNNTKAWKHLCFSPCELDLDLPASLRVTGDRLIASDPFTLSGQRSAFDLQADTVSRQERTFHAVLGVGGGVLAANGIGLLLGSALLNAMGNTTKEEIDVSKTAEVMLISGAIALGVGTIAGLFGLHGLFDTTTVTIE
jgi:hypothetical protein